MSEDGAVGDRYTDLIVLELMIRWQVPPDLWDDPELVALVEGSSAFAVAKLRREMRTLVDVATNPLQRAVARLLVWRMDHQLKRRGL